MSVLERFIGTQNLEVEEAAISAISAICEQPGGENSTNSRGVGAEKGDNVLDFDLEKARRDAEKRNEARREPLEPVLQMMAEDNGARNFYCRAYDGVDPDYVVLSFAIPGKGSGELSVPREKYDPGKLMDVLTNAKVGEGDGG